MAAADPQAFFLTPPPRRHLAELRIDTAPSAVAFSAPCAATKGVGRKRRCLVPGSSVRKRMLLELAPFEVVARSPSSTPPPPSSPPPSPMASLLAGTPRSLVPSASPPPSPSPSSTPPPSPSPTSTPPPSPMVSRVAGATPSPAREFSFGTVLRVAPPASPGNIVKFVGNAAGTPAGSEASSSVTPLGHAPEPVTGVIAFLAAPKTPTATGPTASGSFVFAPPSEGPLTPTSTNTSGALSFVASPNLPLTPMGCTASGGGFAASFRNGAVVPLIFLKPACTRDFAFPSPGAACSQIGSTPPPAAKESMPLAAPATPPSAFRTSQPPPPLRNSGDKRPSLFLRRDATSDHRKTLRQLEEQRQSTPPLQKIAKTNSFAAGEAFLSSIVSGSSASPCCTFFISPSNKVARQEAEQVSEASQSSAGSHCSSPATPEKANKQEQEVEVSSSPRERGPASPRECAPTSPAVLCTGTEVVVRVTCKCGVHKDFCFDHRL